MSRFTPMAGPNHAGHGWLPLLLASPAAITLLLVVGAAIYTQFGPDELSFYRRKALRAAQRGDGRSQSFALECLLALEPANRATRWELAQVYRATGRAGLFAEISADLITPERPGYAPAQIDAARRLLDSLERQTPDGSSGQDRLLRAAMAHLRQALADQPKHPEATERLVDLLEAVGEAAEARELATTLPAAGLTASMSIRKAWLESGGDAAKVPDSALSQAAALESMAFQPDAPGHVRRAHALASELRGNLSAAFGVWIAQLKPDRPEFRQAEARRRLMGLHVRRADEAFNKLPRDYETMAESVSRGLALDPNSQPLLERLVILANPSGTRAETSPGQPVRDKAAAHLNDLLAKGTSPALLHLLLAGDYHRNRRQDMARLHFELAHRADPKAAVVANNLAWYLINTVPRDPERALALVNSALESGLVNPSFLETRGQIRAILGDDAAAVADLEAAGRALGMSRAIHQALARCYGRLGDTEQSKRHDDMARGKGP